MKKSNKTPKGTRMSSTLEDENGNQVTVITKQFGNGISITTNVKVTGLPSASFDDSIIYHKKLREEIVKNGGKVISGNKLSNKDNKFKTLEK